MKSITQNAINYILQKHPFFDTFLRNTGCLQSIFTGMYFLKNIEKAEYAVSPIHITKKVVISSFLI